MDWVGKPSVLGDRGTQFHINEEGFQWGTDLSIGGKTQLNEQEGGWCRGQAASSV